MQEIVTDGCFLCACIPMATLTRTGTACNNGSQNVYKLVALACQLSRCYDQLGHNMQQLLH